MTTYQVYALIKKTRTVDELRLWAGCHNVKKTNQYIWSTAKVNELLEEYKFKDRIEFKTSYGKPE